MALSIIGAGFGRTGTESMKLALEMLGLGPCHHMTEVLPRPEQVALWRAAAAGAPPDWERAFAGYNAAVDWPAAYFWRPLSAYYPDAKILLTVRSAESWYASMERTLFKVIKGGTDPASVGVKLIGEGVFGGRIGDRAHAIAVYERNIADVEAAFGADRLLTHQLGDGWDRLCRFLDQPVPETPFPRTNSSAEFDAMMAKVNDGA